MLKKCFHTSIKVTDMIKGETVVVKTRSEQDSIIKRLLLDFVEIMNNIEVATTFFPESMLETVRNTALPILIANVYCLMLGPVKHLWLQESYMEPQLDFIRKQVKRVALHTCMDILDIAIIRHIGKHVKNYAIV